VLIFIVLNAIFSSKSSATRSESTNAVTDGGEIVTEQHRNLRELISFHTLLMLKPFDPSTYDPKELRQPKVAVQQVLYFQTGGPEALLQLTMAFHSWMPNDTYMLYHDFSHLTPWLETYPELEEVSQMADTDELVSGDIFIIPEIDCPAHLVARGVHVYRWMLGALSFEANQKSKEAGCKDLSHNFWLSQNLGLNVEKDFVLRPYISPNKKPSHLPSNEKRENLILVNGDDNPTVPHIKSVQEYCEATGDCQIQILKGFTRVELMDLYQRAKVILAMCMRGCERTPIEAVLSGVVMVTDYCHTGKDERDVPVPSSLIIGHPGNDLSPVEIVKSVLTDFETAQAESNAMRELYLGLGPETLAEETKHFMYIHLAHPANAII